jgi:hypothetical protein
MVMGVAFGLQWINRLGNLITEIPWSANYSIQVTLDYEQEKVSGLNGTNLSHRRNM